MATCCETRKWKQPAVKSTHVRSLQWNYRMPADYCGMNGCTQGFVPTVKWMNAGSLLWNKRMQGAYCKMKQSWQPAVKNECRQNTVKWRMKAAYCRMKQWWQPTVNWTHAGRVLWNKGMLATYCEKDCWQLRVKWGNAGSLQWNKRMHAACFKMKECCQPTVKCLDASSLRIQVANCERNECWQPLVNKGNGVILL